MATPGPGGSPMRRDRIEPARTEGMAARDAPDREPAASHHAMLAQCLDHVLRARRQMAAMRRHERRQYELVETHRAGKDPAGKRETVTATRRRPAAPDPCPPFHVRAPLLPLEGRGARSRASGLRRSGPPFRGIGVHDRAPGIPRGEKSCAVHTTRNSTPEGNRVGGIVQSSTCPARRRPPAACPSSWITARIFKRPPPGMYNRRP